MSLMNAPISPDAILRSPEKYSRRTVRVEGTLFLNEPRWICTTEMRDVPIFRKGILFDCPGLGGVLRSPDRFTVLGVPLPDVLADAVGVVEPGRVLDEEVGEAVATLTAISSLRLREETLPPPVPGSVDKLGYGVAADGSQVWDQKGADRWREIDLRAVAREARRIAAAAERERAGPPEPTMEEVFDRLTPEQRDELLNGEGTHFEIP